MLVINWIAVRLSGDDLIIPATNALADEPLLFVLPHAVADRKLRRSGLCLLQSVSDYRAIGEAADKACRPERMRGIDGIDRVSLSDTDFDSRLG